MKYKVGMIVTVLPGYGYVCLNELDLVTIGVSYMQPHIITDVFCKDTE